MDPIEKWLTTPLAAIVDNGFSKQVMANIQHYQNIRHTILVSVFILLAIGTSAFLSLTSLLQTFISQFVQLLMPVQQMLPKYLPLDSSLLLKQPINIGCLVIMISLFALFTYKAIND